MSLIIFLQKLMSSLRNSYTLRGLFEDATEGSRGSQVIRGFPVALSMHSMGERVEVFRGLFAAIPLSVLGSYDVPWVPTRRQLIDYVMRIARVGEGDIFYDLGCGDGRVAIEAARRGAKAVCVELRKDLIEAAMENARKAGVYDRVKFVNDDFFKVPIGDATVVYMYLLTRVNAALKPKLEKELKVGTRIVTLDFAIPGWKPVHVERYYIAGLVRTLYLYIRGVSDIKPTRSPISET
ncbi:class I SAM-dependent methyltransferase [Hyperthermus butylicus]|uniref:class I SAM-dependent methyltransferase n=1 Tax=Hyperthermus butylicus TaxID=54248 RepID=UPI001E305B49|nr:class I SAM-dependent methyltransferase [Hyperthermus butylicus]